MVYLKRVLHFSAKTYHHFISLKKVHKFVKKKVKSTGHYTIVGIDQWFREFFLFFDEICLLIGGIRDILSLGSRSFCYLRERGFKIKLLVKDHVKPIGPPILTNEKHAYVSQSEATKETSNKIRVSANHLSI